MDAYLEEELFDLFTFCIKEPRSPDVPAKKQRIEEIGREFYSDGGADALENMFSALENRIRDEIGQMPSRCARGGTGLPANGITDLIFWS